MSQELTEEQKSVLLSAKDAIVFDEGVIDGAVKELDKMVNGNVPISEGAIRHVIWLLKEPNVSAAAFMDYADTALIPF